MQEKTASFNSVYWALTKLLRKAALNTGSTSQVYNQVKLDETDKIKDLGRSATGSFRPTRAPSRQQEFINEACKYVGIT